MTPSSWARSRAPGAGGLCAGAPAGASQVAALAITAFPHELALNRHCYRCPWPAVFVARQSRDRRDDLERVALGRRENSMIGFRWTGAEPKDLNEVDLAEEFGAT